MIKCVNCKMSVDEGATFHVDNIIDNNIIHYYHLCDNCLSYQYCKCGETNSDNFIYRYNKCDKCNVFKHYDYHNDNYNKVIFAISIANIANIISDENNYHTNNHIINDTENIVCVIDTKRIIFFDKCSENRLIVSIENNIGDTNLSNQYCRFNYDNWKIVFTAIRSIDWRNDTPSIDIDINSDCIMCFND